jgi:hypothetical protein
MSVILQFLLIVAVLVIFIGFRVWSDRAIQRQRGGCGHIHGSCSHKHESSCSRHQ